MKRLKIGTILLAGLLCAVTMFGCGGEKALTFAMPMGAPALAAAKPMSDGARIDGHETTYTVVAADDISASVRTESADVAILPVNAAATLLGKGDEANTYAKKYKIVSVVTHGNLFLLRKGAVQTDRLKKVAVKNLDAVPGLTYRTVLGVGNYTSDAGEAQIGKPLLVEAGDAPAKQLTEGGADAIVVPEPACSNILATPVAAKLNLVKESLQDASVWGTSGGYAQAVLVVKTELATAAFVEDLLAKLEENAAWISESADGALAHRDEILASVTDHRASDGIAVPFGAENLTPDCVKGCNISVQRGADAKTACVDYLTKIRAAAPKTKLPSDDFFYFG